MKNRLLVPFIYVVMGVIVALIPFVLFPVCPSHEMRMACYYTKQAELGIGIVVAALGLIYIVFNDTGVRKGLSIAQLLNALLVILFPLKLTGLCSGSEMACRIGTKPALTVAGVLIAAFSLINIIILKAAKKDKHNEE